MKEVEAFLLDAGDATLVIVDAQERLAAVMDERGKVVKNIGYLIELAKDFKIPIIVTEQYPKGLGYTVPEIAGMLPEGSPIEKLAFDCCGEGAFLDTLKKHGRKKVIVTGMETHVCVLQTVLSLIKAGYIVHLVSDAVCSRDADNKRTALEMLARAGAVVTCAETVLFQVMKRAGTDEFRKISKMIK